MATLAKELTCYFGSGKSLKNRETTELAAGTEILSRFDADGVHKFTVMEFGRTATYAVDSASVLDAYLSGSEFAEADKQEAIMQIRSLMKKFSISKSDI